MPLPPITGLFAGLQATPFPRSAQFQALQSFGDALADERTWIDQQQILLAVGDPRDVQREMMNCVRTKATVLTEALSVRPSLATSLSRLFAEPMAFGSQDSSNLQIERLIQNRLEPRDAQALIPQLFPKQFKIYSRAYTRLDDPEIASMLNGLFRGPVSLRDLLLAFSVRLPGFRVDRLDFDSMDGRSVRIEGHVAGENGADAGVFIFQMPTLLNRTNGAASLQEMTMLVQKTGIASDIHQGVLSFLSRYGYKSIDLLAAMDGPVAWPAIGYHCPDAHIIDVLKVRFRLHLKTNGITLSPEQERQWLHFRSLWDIIDFELDGRPVGREFLVNPEFAVAPLRLVFPLEHSYPGWRRLFKILG